MIAPSSDAPWWHHAFAFECSIHASTIRLERAATLLSAHRSQLVREPAAVERVQRNLDDLAASVPVPTFDGWLRHLFVTCGFAGNGNDYHDVRNSFLPDVLTRRIGIPISLAVVGIAVAERLALPVWGVGMPGHFLLAHADTPATPTDPLPEGTRFIDPFNGGDVFGLDGCRQRYTAMFGADRPFDEAMMFRTDEAAILLRMLANLKANYARIRDIEGLTAVMRLRNCLPGASLDEGRELVRLLDAVGCWTEAEGVLNALDAAHPEADAILAFERARLTAQLN